MRIERSGLCTLGLRRLVKVEVYNHVSNPNLGFPYAWMQRARAKRNAANSNLISEKWWS